MLEHLVHAFVEVLGVLVCFIRERIGPPSLRQTNSSFFASKRLYDQVPTLRFRRSWLPSPNPPNPPNGGLLRTRL